jgi:hypothetical protein
MTILSNKPKAIRKNAQMFIRNEKISEIPANISPNINAFFGDIRPDGIGRSFVLSMIASISLSLYPVRVSAAAEPAATPHNNKIHVLRLTDIWNNHDAEIAVPKAVKTSKYQILGFVSS